MKILLISSSARGHAIADAFARSPQKPEIISLCPNANPGIRNVSSEQYVLDILNFEEVCAIAKKIQPDFAFIGPDDPIGAGLADALEEIGIPSVAPKKALAQIESSKGFTRHLLQKYDIDASPKFRVFEEKDATEIFRYLSDELRGEYVVKYDALKGGKGVKLSGEHLQTIDEGVAYALDCIEECGRVVLEEKLIGIEFSLLSFVSGTQVVHMPAVQDHKRAYEGDTGPNTGGMGTYSDANHALPFLEEKDLQRAKEINHEVSAALLRLCGMPYKGILYGGFIAVRDGVRLIEYNARFGDPEALNLLPLLESDFVTICQAIVNGELTEDLVQFAHKATVCKYIVPEGYPVNKDQKGEEIKLPLSFKGEGWGEGSPKKVHIFLGDVAMCHSEHCRTMTSNVSHFDRVQCDTCILGTSRTAGIVGIADTIEEAESIAQNLCEQVQGPVRFRSDIGKKEVIQERKETMENIRIHQLIN